MGGLDYNRIPIVARNGNLQMQVTEAQGREQIILRPAYATSHNALPKGQRAYSLRLGLNQEGDSDLPMVAGTWSRGRTERLTTEYRAEAAPGLSVLGASAFWTSEKIGRFTGSIVSSMHEGNPGARAVLGYDFLKPKFAFGGRAEVGTANYAAIGLRDDNIEKRAPTRIFQAYAGYFPAELPPMLVTFLDIDDQGRDIRVVEGSTVTNMGRLGYMRYSCMQAVSPETFTAFNVTYIKPLGRKI